MAWPSWPASRAGVPDNPTTVWTAVEADPVRREGPEVPVDQVRWLGAAVCCAPGAGRRIARRGGESDAWSPPGAICLRVAHDRRGRTGCVATLSVTNRTVGPPVWIPVCWEASADRRARPTPRSRIARFGTASTIMLAGRLPYRSSRMGASSACASGHGLRRRLAVFDGGPPDRVPGGGRRCLGGRLVTWVLGHGGRAAMVLAWPPAGRSRATAKPSDRTMRSRGFAVHAPDTLATPTGSPGI